MGAVDPAGQRAGAAIRLGPRAGRGVPLIWTYATRDHHARHLAPIAEALGADHAGLLTRPGQIPRDGSPILIAGPEALDVTGRHPVALVEHGAGQRYLGLDHRSWGGRMDRVGLFLTPRAGVQPADREVVVGCPALDAALRSERDRLRNERPVVAFTFHWDAPAARQIPELRSAFPHYRDALPGIVRELRDAGCEVVGHAHPRMRALFRWWKAHGVDVELDWDHLLGKVDVLVADNTSALPEAAALGRGTVWLRSPEWRPSVIHGGRFYEWERFGTSADGPGDVVAAVLAEAEREHDGPEVMRAVYTYDDGQCAERAADAVRKWVRSL